MKQKKNEYMNTKNAAVPSLVVIKISDLDS